MFNEFSNDEYVRVSNQKSFIQIETNFIRNNEYNIYQKMVYMELFSHASDRRPVYPSHQYIADVLGISKRKVISTLKELEDLEAVYIINQVYTGTKNKISNLYYLAEINKEGKFDSKQLDIIKKMYPTRVKYLDKKY